MNFFNTDKTFDFMSKGKLFLVISSILIVLSFVMVFSKGLTYGIDFAGGSLVQLKYTGDAPIDLIRDELAKEPIFANPNVTEFGSKNEVIIKFTTTLTSVGEDIGDITKKTLANTGEFEVRRVDMVGPKVGDELREKGLMALGLSILAILIYITFRFEFRFALASIIALVHDISISIGAIALFKIDVNLDILAAILTIIGYSLNDTIIVFDRIREAIKETSIANLDDLINQSVSKTLSRTTLTSLTTLFVVATLYLFGGEIIEGFSFVLLVGIVVGTYSSIFIAANLLTFLKFDIKKYRENEAIAKKREMEKDKIRAMYEKGVV
jgi:preprotein translocase subunit SecF